MKAIRGFTTTSEAQYESQLSYLASAVGAKARRAFTLIETMIAVTILTTAVAGPLFAASRSIVAAQISRDQLTASYLAQEGIEYIRAMRDNEFLAVNSLHGPTVSADSWTAFLTNTSSDDNSISLCRTASCSLEPTRSMGSASGKSLFQCALGAACAKLYLVPGGGYITDRSTQIGTAAPTGFSRTIQLTDVSGTADPVLPAPPYPDKIAVSIVSWNFHGTQYSVKITDHLTPWQ
jgi:prepilin-type N-terminal cleavage/methylation domain-containing protein